MPYPNRKTYPWDEMRAGQSFLVPYTDGSIEKTENNLTSCRSVAQKKTGMRFTFQRTYKGLKVTCVGLIQDGLFTEDELKAIVKCNSSMARKVLKNYFLRERRNQWERSRVQKSESMPSVQRKEPKPEMRALGNSRGKNDNSKSGKNAVLVG